MSVSEIERVKQDIATIKEAAGLELPFGWDSVWVNLIGLPCAGLGCLLYWWIFHRPSVFMVLTPAILLQVVDRCVRPKYRPSASRSATKRRGYKVGLYGGIFIGAVMGAFMGWAIQAGISVATLTSGAITMSGLTATLMAFQRKETLPLLGLGIPATLVGISIAVWPTADAIVRNACIALFVAGPAMAFIQMCQLKRYGIKK